MNSVPVTLCASVWSVSALMLSHNAKKKLDKYKLIGGLIDRASAWDVYIWTFESKCTRQKIVIHYCTTTNLDSQNKCKGARPSARHPSIEKAVKHVQSTTAFTRSLLVLYAQAVLVYKAAWIKHSSASIFFRTILAALRLQHEWTKLR